MFVIILLLTIASGTLGFRGSFKGTLEGTRRHVSAVETVAPALETSDSILNRFITSYRAALEGNQQPLDQLIQPTTQWDSPVAATLIETRKSLTQFSGFFQEPALTVFQQTQLSTNKYKLNYHLSFWYPMLWRPRIIIPASCIIEFSSDNKLVSVQETWEISLFDILLKQLPPRFWDLWNSLSTPTPEYPPIKHLSSVGKVSFLEMPQTLAIEIKWAAPSKYPGPPLLAIPSFGLFGALRTSRPNRDPIFTALPVEVQSGRFVCPELNEEMKTTSWTIHVPTSLQHHVYDKAVARTVFPLADTEELESADDLVDELDYQVGLENINVMKSATGGVLRGNVTFNTELMRDFEAKEKKEYQYKLAPKRIIAAMDIKGDASAAKISEALKTIKETVARDSARVLGKAAKMRSRDLNQAPSNEGTPLLGLQLWSCKGCFNPKAEPAMAAYELQYDGRLTKVFVELAFDN